METLTGRRRIVFSAVALALPWVLLLIVEIGLRIGGYGSSYPLFVRHAAQPEYLVANPRVARRYFGAGPFTPTPELDFFRATRQPGTYRVFMQGGSSAQGFPYGHGGAPSRMLEQRLQAALPDREIEVVNTALTAVNSHALLDQADEIIAQQPDAVLIYSGHNEYYGALGVGSTRSVGRWRPFVRTYLMIRHVRTAQLVEDLAGRVMLASRERTAGAPRTAMQMMAGDLQIPYDSPRYRQGLEQFRANITDLLARYRERGIPVLIGTVASNERDQPPLIGGLAPGTDSAAWDRSYRAGVDALQRGDTAGARRSLDATVRMDSTAASTHFAFGRLHDLRGDSIQAQASYRRAKDFDQLRFRAPEAINRVIREEAARHGAVVVETQRALQERSRGGVIDGGVMLEHLHPNLDGYFLIATAFHDAMQQRGMAGLSPETAVRAPTRVDIPVTVVDSLVGVLRTDRLVSSWPFRPAGAERTPIVDTLRPARDAERLAQAVVVGDLPWPEATERLRASSEKAGDYHESLRAARALAFEYSYSAEPYVDAARVALLQDRHDDALEYITVANRRRETASSAHLAGLLMLRQGHHAPALRYLQRAAALAPGDERIALAHRAAAALPDLERRLGASPRDTNLLYDLGGAYALTQQYGKAREVLATLTRLAPGHAGARNLIARLPR